MSLIVLSPSGPSLINRRKFWYGSHWYFPIGKCSPKIGKFLRDFFSGCRIHIALVVVQVEGTLAVVRYTERRSWVGRRLFKMIQISVSGIRLCDAEIGILKHGYREEMAHGITVFFI